MGFWSLKKRAPESAEEKQARRERRMRRDMDTYDSIMAAFVQPMPSFSQWAQPIPRGGPPSYESAAQYVPATYYPNQNYENPYGQPGHKYVAYSSEGSMSSQETLPTYVDSTYTPWSRQ